MTTDAILSLIDVRLSKAHLDGNQQAAMALNELRERIGLSSIKSPDTARIQEQAAQLCAVRTAAGMQVGTIEELCQRIKALRADAWKWRQDQYENGLKAP